MPAEMNTEIFRHMTFDLPALGSRGNIVSKTDLLTLCQRSFFISVFKAPETRSLGENLVKECDRATKNNDCIMGS